MGRKVSFGPFAVVRMVQSKVTNFICLLPSVGIAIVIGGNCHFTVVLYIFGGTLFSGGVAVGSGRLRLRLRSW